MKNLTQCFLEQKGLVLKHSCFKFKKALGPVPYPIHRVDHNSRKERAQNTSQRGQMGTPLKRSLVKQAWDPILDANFGSRISDGLCSLSRGDVLENMPSVKTNVTNYCCKKTAWEDIFLCWLLVRFKLSCHNGFFASQNLMLQPWCGGKSVCGEMLQYQWPMIDGTISWAQVTVCCPFGKKKCYQSSLSLQHWNPVFSNKCFLLDIFLWQSKIFKKSSSLLQAGETRKWRFLMGLRGQTDVHQLTCWPKQEELLRTILLQNVFSQDKGVRSSLSVEQQRPV